MIRAMPFELVFRLQRRLFLYDSTSGFCFAGRQFSVANEHLLRRVPINERPGGEVFVLDGCCYPLVLRMKVSEYELLGDAYVHSFMRGEANPLPGSAMMDTEIV